MVMFDLPTSTVKERKNYSIFRNALLDNGFSMSQYSVYFRFCGEKECCEKHSCHFLFSRSNFFVIIIDQIGADVKWEFLFFCFVCKIFC